jgi:hypothetical protein
LKSHPNGKVSIRVNITAMTRLKYRPDGKVSIGAKMLLTMGETASNHTTGWMSIMMNGGERQ